MKVCIFLSDFTKIGGIERVSSTLATRLCDYSEYNIEVVSMFKGRVEANYFLPNKVGVTYLLSKSHGVKPHSFRRIISMLSNLKVVRDYFHSHTYDWIIAQSFPMVMALFLCGIKREKIIGVEHVYSSYYGNLTQKIRDYIYNRIKAVVVLTSADKLFLKNRLKQKNITVIPNPTKIVNNGISDLNNKRIISIGRLEYQKGYDNLIHAFSQIHPEYPDWELKIYGDGSLKQALNALIQKLGLTSCVELCGTTNNIDAKLQESSIFVMSSRFEGFGMVLVEALSNGVPCISFDCPNGPSDIIINGLNGILVENQNSAKLIEAIKLLIKNETLRKKLGENCPNSVKTFDEKIVAEKWRTLFETLSY